MEETIETTATTSEYRETSTKRRSEMSTKPIFDALERADIDYCVLRGLDELYQIGGNLEIDLLIRYRQRRLFAQTVAELGFYQYPSWGHFPHFFFIAFDEKNGRWIKLDVVTALHYGNPTRRYRVDLVNDCLAQRRREEVYVLSHEHEFITLLLHCLLDKGHFKEGHCKRLKELRAIIERDESVARKVSRHVDRYLAPFLSLEVILDNIARDDWKKLGTCKASIARGFFFNQPAISFYRNLRARLLRKMRPLLFALLRRGVSVALLAPDGAGKTTLAHSLTQDRHIRGCLIYMGTNLASSTIGLPTTAWLKKKIKSPEFNKLGPFKIVLRALNYMNRLAEQWYRVGAGLAFKLKGRFVIYDRYVYDSFLAPKAKSIGKRIRRWLIRSTTPSPDLVVFLDAPGEVLFARKGEHSPEILNQQRKVFLSLQDKISNMEIVDATQNADNVRHRVIALLWKRYSGCVYGDGVNGRLH